MFEQIKQFKEVIGLIIALGAVFMGIGGYILDWRISANVDEVLSKKAAGAPVVVTAEQMEVIKTELMAINTTVTDLKKADERFDDRFDQIIKILLEE